MPEDADADNISGRTLHSRPMRDEGVRPPKRRTERCDVLLQGSPSQGSDRLLTINLRDLSPCPNIFPLSSIPSSHFFMEFRFLAVCSMSIAIIERQLTTKL